MRTDVEIGLTLYEYCMYLGIDPWVMSQFGEGFPANLTVCDKPMFQHPYQQDALSRDEFGLAINEAEQRIAEQLMFWTFPRYTLNEIVQYPHPSDTRLNGGGGDTHNMWKAVQLNYGKVIGAGIRNSAVLGLNQAVVLTDEDGDGIYERFTITVLNVSATLDVSQVGVYIKAADRVAFNTADGERWRIRPILSTVSGTTLTIKGHTSTIVKPELYEGFAVVALNVTDNTNFLDHLDVYRVYLDDTATVDNPYQGTSMWENGNCDLPPCGVAYYPICVGSRNADLGKVSVNWNQVSAAPFRYDPDRLQMNYLSGLPLVNDMTQTAYGDAVAKFATALLARKPCSCDRADKILVTWQKPIYESDEEEQPSFAPDDAASNPFGVQRGAVFAWRFVEQMKQVRGMVLP